MSGHCACSPSLFEISYFLGQSLQHPVSRSETWPYGCAGSFQCLSRPSSAPRARLNHRKISVRTSCRLGENPYRVASSPWQYNLGLSHMWVSDKSGKPVTALLLPSNTQLDSMTNPYFLQLPSSTCNIFVISAVWVIVTACLIRVKNLYGYIGY